MNKTYATVDELVKILNTLQRQGHGDAVVYCNEEYGFSKPTYEEEAPEISDFKGKKCANFGGYC